MESATGAPGEADSTGVAAVAGGSHYGDGVTAGNDHQEQQETQTLQDGEQQQQQEASSEGGPGCTGSVDEPPQHQAPASLQQQDSTDGVQQAEQPQEEDQQQEEGDAQRGADAASGRNSTSISRGENPDNQSRKLFVGGLSRMTTTDSLRTYFQQYGEVEDSEVLFDKLTGRSRGFGFITFVSAEPVARVADVRHTVDGTQVEVRRAIPREEARDQGSSSGDREAGRLFVGGISDDVTDETLRSYFRHYGEIQSANAMFDRQNNRPRGFAFVIFRNPEDAEKAIGPHKKLGVHCEAKRAQPRQMNRPGAGAWPMGGGGGAYGSYSGSGGYAPRREGGYGRGGMRDYDSYGPGGGYGMGGAASMYGPGGYGGYAANYNPYYAAYYAPHYNPYHAAYYAKMAAYSAMGGYGGYGAAAGGYGEDGYSTGGGGADRGGRMANRSTPY